MGKTGKVDVGEDLIVTLRLRSEKELICDQETIDEYYGGSWKNYIKSMLKDQGKFEFIDWFEIVDVVDSK
jgi:hypothetical protein